MLALQTQHSRQVGRRLATTKRHLLYVVRWEGSPMPSFTVETTWPVTPNATVLFKVKGESHVEALSTAAWMCAEIAHARAVAMVQ